MKMCRRVLLRSTLCGYVRKNDIRKQNMILISEKCQQVLDVLAYRYKNVCIIGSSHFPCMQIRALHSHIKTNYPNVFVLSAFIVTEIHFIYRTWLIPTSFLSVVYREYHNVNTSTCSFTPQ